MGVPILPTISTTCIVISAILIAIGWRLIWKREINKHKNVMLAAAVFALTFFLIYASRTIFIGNTAFKDKYNVHRKFGPFASVIWFCTAITGVAVYLLLYVLYPG
ncbi:DUF420 domain-containing protein, partial [Staphylococcus aureus]|nr:DUF420 domain-containing protein [Staphylococcus aureus]